ncbi:ComEC/Rec2 family competence protein [Mycetocola spongiae]|uniref:ComEC/Rec2 family competence protein n=1 Tax=Mycetocola spongiae TaxID=2859226 RepID=UPI001CF41237|nr:ComEC/Rec2 family competence protein [Mycetocola spongiae]UCR89421.1 ComEC/Rec2 family competence protein [Mycetocola spongiae]
MAAALWAVLWVLLPGPGGAPRLASAFAGAGALGVGVAALRRYRRGGAPPRLGRLLIAALALLLCAAAGHLALIQDQRGADSLARALDSGERSTIRGTFASDPTPVGADAQRPEDSGRPRLRASIHIDAVDREPASGTAVLLWTMPTTATGTGTGSATATEAGALARGDPVEVVAAAHPTGAGERPRALLSAVEAPRRATPHPEACAGMLRAAQCAVTHLIAQLRQGLAHRSALLPGDGGALLPGLSIGDTAAVSPALSEAMNGTGLSHLTAVSGANCAVVVSAVFLLVAALGGGRGARVVCAAAALGGFILLVGPDASVLRAAVMGLLSLLCLIRGRPRQGLPLLAAACCVLLILDPWLARDYGFALSVAATAGLLTLVEPIGRRLESRLAPRLARLLAVPLAAQLACGPILILLRPEISPLTVPANMLAEPAAPLATVLGLLACLSAPLLPAVADILARCAWLPAQWIAGIAHTLAGVPGTRWPWPEGIGGALLLAVATAALLVAILRARPRRRALLCCGLCCLLAGSLTAGPGLIGRLLTPRAWVIAACDVGQGDALLLSSAGRVALIDTGPTPEVLSSCLKRLHITRIDLLILTHFDLDHSGGVPAIAGRTEVALLGPSATRRDHRVREDLRHGGATLIEARGSSALRGTLGNLSWRRLWPPREDAGILPGNASSVAVEFRGDGLTSVFLGDLGAEQLNRIARGTPGIAAPGHADVVKVAHHGSADQGDLLYRQLSATIGLISVGAHNSYGHPTRRALTLLREAHTRAVRTDQSGLLLVGISPGGPTLWTERGPPRS